MVAKRRCIDCETEGVGSNRPAPHPGPRCATHHRLKKRERSAGAHSRRLETVYNITAEQYAAILEAQGGCCAICRRAKGIKKRLNLDHDHLCCPGPTSCGKCVRSALCTPCNRMLGHLRDDPVTVERILMYLDYPPGREVLDNWNAQ